MKSKLSLEKRLDKPNSHADVAQLVEREYRKNTLYQVPTFPHIQAISPEITEYFRSMGHSIDPLFFQWLQSRGLSSQTLRYYRAFLGRFFRITNIRSEDFVNERLIKRAFLMVSYHRPCTLSKYKATVEQYSKFMNEHYGFERIYFNKIKLPKSIPTALTKGQVEQVHQAIQTLTPKTQVMVELMLYTGLRRKEVSNLRPEDVKDDGIHVRGAKGDKDRFVYCPNYIIMLVRKISGKETVFNIKPDGITCTFARITKKLPFRLYGHLMRHTYSTMALRSGVDIFTLSRQLGHSSIETTQIYLYANSEQTKETMSKFKII